MFQLHLCGGGCSGRGVRVRLLTPDEIDEASIEAGRDAPDASDKEKRGIQTVRSSMRRMIVSVTEPAAKEALATAKWTPVNQMSLAEPGAWSRMFNACDDQVLTRWFTRNHMPGAEFIDDILGKALPVTE